MPSWLLGIGQRRNPAFRNIAVTDSHPSISTCFSKWRNCAPVILKLMAIFFMLRLLPARRRGAAPNPEGRWEFIGGKIEPGETPEEALVRECREELALEIEEVRIIDSVVHEYPEKTIRLTLLECRPKAGSVPQALEHQAICWVTPEEMRTMQFCPADAELLPRLFDYL